ncbi:K+-transporting ATPase ATPase A chain [Nocardia sp. GAS34]|uniref:potassium-transporting ATPase subunit KdpA n=1 Tax=unclassified Nocardia TaxID=2637762 RepID=UPI003D20FAE6
MAEPQWGTAAWLQVAAVIIIIAAVHVPLGDYMARVFTSSRDLRAERAIYRLVGVEPRDEQNWKKYLGSLLAFSGISVLSLYALLLIQQYLPAPWGRPGMTPALAFDTAVSFVTNTSWQNYSPEQIMGHFGLMAGLGVQAFASAAVGICAAMALIRGLSRHRTDEVGNFWVDLIRGIVRILLPIAAILSLVFLVAGVVQGASPVEVHTITGGSQTILRAPAASWEPIKLMSGDGGGAFNVNSAHPFENPTPWTNVLEMVAMLLIPASLVRTFGVMVGDKRQSWALLAVVGFLFALGLGLMMGAEAHVGQTVVQAAGAAAEGTETRFGVPGSAVFGQVATATADGAANSAYDSFTSFGGAVLMGNMMLGEVAPGGAGSGLYALLLMALLAMFLGGLMVGKTPEYLQKRVGARETKLVGLFILTGPAVILTGTAIAMTLPGERAAMANTGAHELSEVLYAFTSSGAGNGSAFAGLSGNTTWWNTALAVAMLLGRYLPMIFVLALAGSFAAQQRGVVTVGHVATHRPMFVGLVVGTTLVVVGLEYFPALALGPLADGLH